MYFAVCSEMLFCVCAILTDTLVRIQLVAYRGKKRDAVHCDPHIA